MKKELCEALHQDLGKGEFENWTYELHLCIRDADHAIANLKDWMKEKSVDTPIMIGPG
jgi:hypothetical protein